MHVQSDNNILKAFFLMSKFLSILCGNYVFPTVDQGNDSF